MYGLCEHRERLLSAARASATMLLQLDSRLLAASSPGNKVIVN